VRDAYWADVERLLSGVFPCGFNSRAGLHVRFQFKICRRAAQETPQLLPHIRYTKREKAARNPSGPKVALKVIQEVVRFSFGAEAENLIPSFLVVSGKSRRRRLQFTAALPGLLVWTSPISSPTTPQQRVTKH